MSEAAVVTFEFENVSGFSTNVPVRPSFEALRIAQNRIREKTWLSENNVPVTPFRQIANREDFDGFAYPAILKTAGFGYDGKGQSRVRSRDEAIAAWNREPAVLEEAIDFSREVSVVCARGIDAGFAHYGVIENSHSKHILDVSKAPATGADDAPRIAEDIVEKLDFVGVMCVEFFETRDGRLLVNELAPRPHNSGHLTIEAAPCSQFEQQVRAICGLPLGGTQLRPAAMANLLGDLWANGEPNWAAALADNRVRLHLYGKREPRPGRKMGHLTVVAATADEAAQAVRAARERLNSN